MIPISKMYEALTEDKEFRKSFRMKNRTRPISREVIRRVVDELRGCEENSNRGDNAIETEQARFASDFLRLVKETRFQLQEMLSARDSVRERVLDALARCHDQEVWRAAQRAPYKEYKPYEYDENRARRNFSSETSRLLGTLSKLEAAAGRAFTQVTPLSNCYRSDGQHIEEAIANILSIVAENVELAKGKNDPCRIRRKTPAREVLEAFLRHMVRIVDFPSEDEIVGFVDRFLEGQSGLSQKTSPPADSTFS